MGDKNTQQELPSLEGDFCFLVCSVDSFELVRRVQVQPRNSRGQIDGFWLIELKIRFNADFVHDVVSGIIKLWIILEIKNNAPKQSRAGMELGQWLKFRKIVLSRGATRKLFGKIFAI